MRVTECSGVVRAENVYTLLVEQHVGCIPGWRGRLKVTFDNHMRHTFRVEVRANAVWRLGRVFLVCDQCGQRCTRLYAPLPESWLACRRCWGLTYDSRQHRNYKDIVPRFE